MKSRFSQILMAIGALLAFIPVLGVDYFLDFYVKDQATMKFQESVNTISVRNQTAIFDAIDSINTIVRESPSLCTPTFIANVQKQLLSNHQLAQIIVENNDRVQYCDGFASETKYSLLSNIMPLVGLEEKISIVKLENSSGYKVKISHSTGSGKNVVAFVHINANFDGIISNEFLSNSISTVAFTSGEEIITLGKLSDNRSDEQKHSDITVSSIAQSLPIVTTATVSFSAVRAYFADIYILFTIIAALFGVGVLLIIIFALRSSNLPTIDLERAIAKGEFQPYYQPVVNLKTGALVGCEVLVRWVKKDGTVLTPGFFIDLAESSGLAVPMTIKLMEQVKQDLSELSKEYSGLKIGINLFEGHFRDSVIVEDVKDIFADSDILFSQLVFEITERRPLTNQVAVDAVIGGLQALGCKLALDDAGTGHSNLAYMQKLGVDIIKIDRVFVNMIGSDSANVPILDGLISMAFDLEAEIIAEGIETEEQAVYLRARGVVQAQGFLFAPAIKKESYIKLAKAMCASQKPSISPSVVKSKSEQQAA